jgi:threonine dehydrogenase-like Zn-dependent dehydrogenase
MKALRFYGCKDLRVEDIAVPKICGHLSEQSGFVGIRNWAWGGMGEYALLNDYNVFKLPDSV